MGPELIARVLESAQRIAAATCDAELQAALDGLPAEWSGGTVAWVPGANGAGANSGAVAAGAATPVYSDGVRVGELRFQGGPGGQRLLAALSGLVGTTMARARPAA